MKKDKIFKEADKINDKHKRVLAAVFFDCQTLN
jgi:hypothetical protein